MKSTIRSISGFVAFGALVVSGLAVSQSLAADSQSSSEDKQSKLISILQSAAPPQEKAITCKKLAVYGKKEAVPALAPLLTDPELSSWARIALEAIPDPAAGEALREAMGKVQGRLLVGVINSIGVRRDTGAVPALVQKLGEADGSVVGAAAVALGRIGGEQAATALVASLSAAPAAVRGEVAEGCVRCAERYLADGKASEAARLYDTVRKASVPKQKMLEATRGAILARKADGLPLLLEQLRSSDKALVGIALRTARELPGQAVTEALAAEWERSDADKQVPLIMVLADRGDASVLPTVRKAAQSGPKPMRLAAVGALERMASVAGVPVLLEIAAEEDRDLSQAAKAALVRLAGKDVNAELVARLAGATGPARRVLVELAGQRRIVEALPAVVACAADPDPGLRNAAVTTIGIIGDEKQLPDLVKLIEKARTPRERSESEKPLLAISGRRGAGCLASVMPLTQSADAEVRIVGLHALSSVGGLAALAGVRAAMNDKDEAVQDEAVRTLATWPGNWPDDSGVAEPLLALAKSARKPAHQVLGLRGYLEYVQGDKKLKDEEKVLRVKELMPSITRPEEKRLAIAALGTASTGDSLEMLVAFAADPAICEEACLAVVNVAAKDDLKGCSKELRQKALQTVLEKSKTNRTKRKADEILKRIQ